MLKASDSLCSPGATSVIHTLIRSPGAGGLVSRAEPGTCDGGVTVPTPWDTLAGGCTCYVTSLWCATNLHFHKLQAFCVHASHHMWIHFFSLLGNPGDKCGRNTSEIHYSRLKRSSQCHKQDGRPFAPKQVHVHVERACATVPAHPVSCWAENIAALLNWELNLHLWGWPGAPGFHCSSYFLQQAVSCTFSVFTDMEI